MMYGCWLVRDIFLFQKTVVQYPAGHGLGPRKTVVEWFYGRSYVKITTVKPFLFFTDKGAAKITEI